MAGLVIAAFASFLPLRYWDRWAGPLSTRPVFLAADLMLNLTIYAYLGPASPFFLYTLGTPLLAGLLFRTTGAILLGFAMLAGYYVLVVLSGNGLAELRAHEARDIQALVVLPALYPLAAAGGAAVRGLLDRQAVTQLALARAERRAAAGAERARVAREMHDSLGKTLYGIALAARGLSHRVEAEAPGAAAAARDLSASAQVAAEEARGLISDLRSDTLDRPLGDALERYVREWSDRNGIAARLQADGVDLPHPGTRYELFCIVREALENVERHAGATQVQVLLRDMAPDVVLSVVDDGVGIGGEGDARSLQTNGHYGLIGMAERGERIGATVRIAGERGAGTTITVRLPAGDVRAPEPWVLEEAVE
jgi:signal transduction histidine kinase